MAMRRFVQFVHGLELKQVRLFAKATIGAAGAVTLDVKNSKGIKAITKQVTAGQYLVTLSDTYNKLLALDAVVSNATGIPAAGVVGIISGSTNVGAGAVMVQLSNAGTATNPASGDALFMEIVLGDSNV